MSDDPDRLELPPMWIAGALSMIQWAANSLYFTESARSTAERVISFSEVLAFPTPKVGNIPTVGSLVLEWRNQGTVLKAVIHSECLVAWTYHDCKQVTTHTEKTPERQVETGRWAMGLFSDGRTNNCTYEEMLSLTEIGVKP